MSPFRFRKDREDDREERVREHIRGRERLLNFRLLHRFRGRRRCPEVTQPVCEPQTSRVRCL